MYTQENSSSPRQRRHEVMRQKILEAARIIIVQHGLQGLSMRGLAEAIDYSPSAIYKYFENKEQILIAIRDEGWQLADAMLATASSVSLLAPPQRLIESGKTFLKFAETYPDHFDLMFNTKDLPIGGPQEIASDPKFKGMINTVAEGVQNGYFILPEGFTPLLMALNFWITSHGMAMLKRTIMSGNRSQFDEICDQLIELLVHSIMIKKI